MIRRNTWGGARPEPWLVRHFPAVMMVVAAAILAALVGAGLGLLSALLAGR